MTPFDRDDMYRLISVIDDVCDHVDEAADNIDAYEIRDVPEKARQQAEVIHRAASRLHDAVSVLQGFKTRSASWPHSGNSRTRATCCLEKRLPTCFARGPTR